MTRTPPKTPALLRLWLGLTWLLAGPIAVVSRRLHARMGADPARFAERRGAGGGGPFVWIHAASLGEVSQVGGLVRALADAGERILVTTTTQAGADWAARELPEVSHRFAPMDTPGAVSAFVSGTTLRAAIFVEGDFGPRLTRAVQAHGIPMVLLNARHSATRARFPAVFGTLLSGFAVITCRSERVARDIESLGVDPARVRVLPDLRIGAARLACPPDAMKPMKERIGGRAVWLAASTHPADEAPVLAAHQEVLKADTDALLIIAPRHPTRGDAIGTLVRAEGLSLARRSRGDAVTADTQVYLADTLGEMGLFFALAPVVFLGGSFGSEGGHNPYEPARFGSAILSGPRVANFADAYEALCGSGAAELVDAHGALGARLVQLLGSDAAQDMGAAGRAFIETSDGSLAETTALIRGVL